MLTGTLFSKKIFLLLLPALILACENDAITKAELKPGGYYSVMNDGESYAIVKIIAIDSLGVHLRLYENIYPQRPESVNLSELRANVNSRKAHMPMLRSAFLRLMPDYLAEAPVTHEELEKYETWKKTGGGYLE